MCFIGIYENVASSKERCSFALISFGAEGSQGKTMEPIVGKVAINPTNLSHTLGAMESGTTPLPPREIICQVPASVTKMSTTR